MKEPNLINDDELIYLIRQGKKEAEELLFSIYRTKLGQVLTSIEKYFYEKIDFDTIKQLYLESIYDSILFYEYDKGLFYSFLVGMVRYAFVNYFRKYSKIYQNEIPNDDKLNNESEVAISFIDSKFYSNHFDSNYYLEIVRKESELEYQLIVMWMKGYSYDEIGKILKISKKRISYLLTKAVERCRKLIKI